MTISDFILFGFVLWASGSATDVILNTLTSFINAIRGKEETVNE